MKHLENIFMVLEYFLLKVNTREIIWLKTNMGMLIKRFWVRIAYVPIQIILLHDFDVCISIAKLNRYVIKST